VGHNNHEGTGQEAVRLARRITPIQNQCENLPGVLQVKGGVPTWKSEYLEGRQRSHKGTAGGLAIQIAAAGDRETAADTNALSGEGCKSTRFYCQI
jgi:hypothetical protein